MNANDIDNRLLAGDLDVDAAGTGVQAAARAKILSSPTLKASSDNPISGFLWFAYLNTKVAAAEQRALPGGDRVRGQQDQPADRLRRPGGRRRDRQHGGPAERRSARSTSTCTTPPPSPTATSPRPRQQLKLCGQPNGFTTGITYRSDRPKEVAAATALQQAAGPGRDQDHAARLPVGHLLQQLRGRAEVHALARHRHRLRRLGAGLAGRLRLLRLHHGRRHDQPGREHQHRAAQRPGGQQRPGQDGQHHQRHASATPTPPRSTCR